MKFNMKLAVLVSLSVVVLDAKAWSPVKNPFDLMALPYQIHTISDCVHVTTEPGDYVFKKIPHLVASREQMGLVEMDDPMKVCGLYVIGEPDTLVELTMKHYNVNCESGGLMGFVDGWELNGEYFPSIHDHHRQLDDRVVEFCNDFSEWPQVVNKKLFRSSQNAALLQYRIPVRGSFIVNVRFHKISQPCNVLVQDVSAIYPLKNYGHARNCTVTALFPAVVAVVDLKVGGKYQRAEKVNYECTANDRLDIGGSAGLESHEMEISNRVCGASDQQGPEQAIFCGLTSIRLLSSGKYQNEASILIRKADENDLEIATLVCPL